VRDAPSSEPESLALLTGPSDGNFLTAIAAQERRVLELKEDLTKAEAGLEKLKLQWAQHEAHKKKNDAKSVTKLQPLQTSIPATPAEEDGDGSNAWMQQEMERRKALLGSNKPTSRTVFSGSKHTRTLSLLSPVNRTPATSALQQTRILHPPRKQSLSEIVEPASPPVRAHRQSMAFPVKPAAPTVEPVKDEVGGLSSKGDVSAYDPENDLLLLETGKKVATNLRDGLWTFWEDLKQVTVGEEATKIEPPARRQSSYQSIRDASRQRNKNSPTQPLKRMTPVKVSPSKRTSPTRPRFSQAMTDTNVPASKESTVTPSAIAELSMSTDFTPPSKQRTTPLKLDKQSGSWASLMLDANRKASPSTFSDKDGWDTWSEASPEASRASSAISDAATLPSMTSSVTTPRTSAEMPKSPEADAILTQSPSKNHRHDPLPWPALSNLGPQSLRRTATRLMAEWDSLEPGKPAEHQGLDDYMGLGAEAAAVATPVTQG